MATLSTDSNLLTSYKVFFSFGCLTFTIATFITLPYFEMGAQQKSDAFSILIKVSAVIFVITQLLELFAAPIPSWRGPLCLVSISGYLAYIYSSEAYKPFNNGIWFIWGAFLISCAAELKILTLVLDKRQFDTIIRRGKSRFIQFGLVATGNVIFLLGTLIFWKIPTLSETGCLFNFVGGCFLSLSIGSFFIGQQKHKGYQGLKVETAMAQRSP